MKINKASKKVIFKMNKTTKKINSMILMMNYALINMEIIKITRNINKNRKKISRDMLIKMELTTQLGKFMNL